MARRQLGHGRGGRMKIETDTVEIRSGPAPRPHPRQPDRGARRQPRLRQLGGADEPLAGRGSRSTRSTCRGPATPTSSAPRSTATPTSATCWSGPAPARPPPASPPARSPAASSPRSASASTATSPRSPRCKAPERPDLGPEDFEGVDDDPVRCLDAEASAAMVEEINRLRKANESLGGSFEVRAFGLVPGPRLAHLLGRPPRRPPRRRRRLDPVGQGRRDRRSLGRRRPARLGGPRRDLLVGGARLLPRDQPRRRPRGRHDQRPAALGASRDQADLDPDQAAALGRHRDQGAGPGAARAHRLDRGPGRRRRRRGDGLPHPGPLLPREVRRRPHRRRAAPRSRHTSSASTSGAEP